MTRSRPRLRDEEGSTLPLIMVYAFVGFVLVLIVVAATSLYLERKRLFSLADATALSAAESFEMRTITLDGTPDLSDAAVLATAHTYLDDNAAGRFESLSLDDASTRGGQSATITLSAVWRPPVLGPLLPEGLRLSVTSTARSAFW